MAKYTLFRAGLDLFDLTLGNSFKQTMRSHTAKTVVLDNWDGSTTTLIGTGLVWNASTGRFSSGTIQSIRHSDEGNVLDIITGLRLPAAQVQAVVEDSALALRELVFKGHDVIDARNRPGHDFLVGESGNDSIAGGTGNDEIYGGSGRDTIDGNEGADLINGGLDDDLLRGMAGGDRLIGDGGGDTLSGASGNDFLFGGAGNDDYFGDSGIDTVVYTRSIGDLIIDAEGAGLRVIEPNGHDDLRGFECIATDEGIFAWTPGTETLKLISTTPGALLLRPGSAVYGTASNNRMVLNGDKTIAVGNGGNDTIAGSDAYDLLIGGTGHDRISGDGGGGSGGDRLHGNNGNDGLSGNGGGDLLYGGTNSDRLNGGRGDDTLTGGGGADVFIFSPDDAAGTPDPWGDDVINDFRLHTDHLQFFFDDGDQVAPELERADDGWLVTIEDLGSILLKGLDVTSLTLRDLLV